MKKTVQKIGKGIQDNTLHALHLGALLALANTIFTLFMVLLAFLSTMVVPVWVNLTIAYPILLVVFWIWFARELRMHYKKFKVHESVLIAKLGVIPFIVLFAVSAVVFTAQFPEGSSALITAGYYGMITGMGNIFLGLTVVTMALHGLHIRVK